MKKSVYEMITERIIEELENGVIPWQRPWSGTFKQWSNLGGKIRKGEKSEVVTFWKIQQIEEINEDGEKTIKQLPLLRYYNVFHISQVDGVEPKEKLEINEHEPIEQAEKIKVDYMEREHLKIFEKVTNDAFYLPIQDYIQVPCKEQYQDIEEFYSTLFH